MGHMPKPNWNINCMDHPHWAGDLIADDIDTRRDATDYAAYAIGGIVEQLSAHEPSQGQIYAGYSRICNARQVLKEVIQKVDG